MLQRYGSIDAIPPQPVSEITISQNEQQTDPERESVETEEEEKQRMENDAKDDTQKEEIDTKVDMGKANDVENESIIHNMNFFATQDYFYS